MNNGFKFAIAAITASLLIGCGGGSSTPTETTPDAPDAPIETTPGETTSLESFVSGKSITLAAADIVGHFSADHTYSESYIKEENASPCSGSWEVLGNDIVNANCSDTSDPTEGSVMWQFIGALQNGMQVTISSDGESATGSISVSNL